MSETIAPEAEAQPEAEETNTFDGKPHGTYATYVAGCRCDDCKQARRDYAHDLTARRQKAGVKTLREAKGKPTTKKTVKRNTTKRTTAPEPQSRERLRRPWAGGAPSTPTLTVPEDPDVIVLGTLSPEARARIMAAWLREQARAIIKVEPRDIDLALSYLHGEPLPPSTNRGSAARGANSRHSAFVRVLRKVVAENPDIKQRIEEVIQGYDHISRTPTPMKKSSTPATLPQGSSSAKKKAAGWTWCAEHGHYFKDIAAHRERHHKQRHHMSAAARQRISDGVRMAAHRRRSNGTNAALARALRTEV